MKKLVFLIIILVSTLTFSWNVYSVQGWWYSGDLTSVNFAIDVWSISPWIEAPWNNVAEWILTTIIQNMMIGLGVISILVMVIWAWYMILHVWDESLLSKWKSIFTWWIYAMIVALASYYIIDLVRYLLYNTL
jgi:hypothetical protein